MCCDYYKYIIVILYSATLFQLFQGGGHVGNLTNSHKSCKQFDIAHIHRNTYIINIVNSH